MAIIWDLTRDVIDPDTQLSKLIATRTDTVKGMALTFGFKGRFKTTVEKKAAWDNIWSQYQALISEESKVDAVVNEGKLYLDTKELI